MTIDLKVIAQSTVIPNGAVLFGANSLSASTPSNYPAARFVQYSEDGNLIGPDGTTTLFNTKVAQAVVAGMAALGLSLPTATWSNSGISYTGLGVNVTDTASAAGSKLLDLQVGGASKFNVSKTGALTLTGGVSSLVSSEASVLQLSYVGVSDWEIRSGIGGTSNLGFYSNTDSAERMRITAGGDVGIGTVSPAAKLHVDDSGGGYLRLSRTAIGGGTSSVAVLQAYTSTTNLANMVVAEDGATDSAHIRFEVKPTGGSLAEAARFTSAKNFGVGISTPYGRLHTAGSGDQEVRFSHTDSATPGRTVTVRLGPSTGGSYDGGGAYMRAIMGAGIDVYTLTFGAVAGSATPVELMRLSPDGNVGFGTTAPTGAQGRTLVLNGGSGQTRIALKNTATGDASGDGFQIAMDSTGNVYFEQRETLDVSFATSNTERMRIDASGNLIHNVNTTAPSLTTNGTMTVERTSNTQLTFKMRGSDGVTRSGTLTLS